MPSVDGDGRLAHLNHLPSRPQDRTLLNQARQLLLIDLDKLGAFPCRENKRLVGGHVHQSLQFQGGQRDSVPGLNDGGIAILEVDPRSQELELRCGARPEEGLNLTQVSFRHVSTGQRYLMEPLSRDRIQIGDSHLEGQLGYRLSKLVRRCRAEKSRRSSRRADRASRKEELR